MASITKQKNGRKRIDFKYANKRHYVSLGKMTMKLANEVKTKVEDVIAARIAGHSPVASTVEWIAGQLKQQSKLAEKLAELDLIRREHRPDVADTLDAFIGSFIVNKSNVKEGTRVTYRQVRKRLVDYFGRDRRLADITAGEAEDWRGWLFDKGLAEATVNRSTGTALQFFNKAIKYKVIDFNPFVGLPTVVRGNPEKYHFIDMPTIEKVIEACPNAEWRLLVGLARYAGLRIPSEVVQFRWGDVDWSNSRFTVTSPKTAHLEGKGTRIVPIFAALLPLLQDAYDMAEEGAEYVIQRFGSEDDRKNDPSQNLRTHFQRIIHKASIEPWVNLWKNLRSSRATELAEKYPEHVLTKWLGNTPKIAKEHYLQVTDEHWARGATEESLQEQSVSKSASVPSGLGRNRAAQRFRKESVSVERATRNTHLHQQVGASKWAIQDSNL